eukprot:TRINITY_DN18508_c0_g1_i1.p1 TRINITY_DN18508_c0_g1~~TRINITY_DN18508_c0_g1_i1.p1  ORF type:complete len:171 (+),score=43.16 TRINITY_DN18508_c0_g1_i1:185-697(+)
MRSQSACIIRHVKTLLLKEVVPSQRVFIAHASTDAQPKKAKGGEKSRDTRTSDGRFDAGSWWKSLEKMKINKNDVKESDPKQLAEDAAVAKQYSRYTMKAHRQQMLEESTRLKLKLAALAALPPNLRAVAQQPDYELFPEHRVAATITPPIVGYSQDAAAEVVTKREKRR